MALQPLRLRRAISLSFSLLHRSLHVPTPICPNLLSAPRPSPTPIPCSTQMPTRLFTSTTTLFRKTFDPEKDEIGPDTILFEGCDYNHWLITVDFPKDSNISREQMIETYVNLAAQIFGSVEEAKKKIYALSTTTYQGFQVECSEETSEKFKSLPGVVFVLPDSYIDPANKEYGGDKYVNGEIFPRPPPVQYARRGNRDRRPREQNYGPPPQQNQGPGPQQNYGPPPQQNYGPRPQQNYGPRPQQNYGPPPQQNYGPPPSQNYGPPQPQNYGLPQQNYAPPSQQNYAPPPPQNYAPPPPQNYAPSPQQNYWQPQQSYAPRPPQGYGSPPEQSFVPKTPQSYGNSPNFSPQQNYNLEGSGERSGSMLPNNASGYGERNSIPSYEGNFNQQEPKIPYAQGQRNLESNVLPEQRGFLKEADYGSSQGGPFEQVSRGQRNFSSNRE